VSASKARLTMENRSLLEQRNHARMQLIRLLTYVINMQEDNPHLSWPDLPDNYDEMTWRYVA
jgi:hypothetical protein